MGIRALMRAVGRDTERQRGGLLKEAALELGTLMRRGAGSQRNGTWHRGRQLPSRPAGSAPSLSSPFAWDPLP